ncbi:hypothetical protein LVD15_18570 [Fulvivirga maritima]|uniref:hypothetical protein n=1 Tax=Fulvivirga maritima TaxID=2904247 RepID=UPI001F47D4B5|nr:hypothetical protein [Fulvivirga maritima]UII25294.1 hypothetical protein LVD15_18570 [Fulvivirga maritima]
MKIEYIKSIISMLTQSQLCEDETDLFDNLYSLSLQELAVAHKRAYAVLRIDSY